MNYYKVITYAEGENYETREEYIDEPTFRQYQQLISEGKDKLILKERILSVSAIKEILPADDEISEHQRQGTFNSLGLGNPQLEQPKQERLTSGFEKIKIEMKNCRACGKEVINAMMKNEICFKCENN